MPIVDLINSNSTIWAIQNDKDGKLESFNNKLNNIPSVLDKQTINKFIDGEYEISLEDYTNLNSYKTSMQSFLGDSSNNLLGSNLNRLLGKTEDNKNTNLTSIKEFLEEMQNRGLSKENAFKLYSSVKTYSLTNSIFEKNSFVSAKI